MKAMTKNKIQIRFLSMLQQKSWKLNLKIGNIQSHKKTRETQFSFNLQNSFHFDEILLQF